LARDPGYFLLVRPLKLAAYAVLAVGIAGLVPYLACPAYHFPGPRPFSGAQFYNPYAGTDLVWRTANLHAHGRVWGGLTDGQQSDSEIVAHYRALGYDVADVSNYEFIDRSLEHDRTIIPTYEHGYNVPKAHFLVLGARWVDWFDFPYGQTREEKQYIIDRLKSSGTLVVLAHPALRNAETLKDMQYLTHYDLLEVLNHFTVSDRQWDAALSSGHAVWAVGDDDTHNVEDAGQTGAMWTMIASRDRDRDSVLAALQAGRTIAVAGQGGKSDAQVDSVVVRADAKGDDWLTVGVHGRVKSISFVGQNGRVLQRTYAGTSASYRISAGDSYVRTVIVTPRTTMYLNPVVRYDGIHLSPPVAVYDHTATWERRGGLLVGAALLAWLAMMLTRFRFVPSIPLPVPEGAD
jgi:hypothetical protein